MLFLLCVCSLCITTNDPPKEERDTGDLTVPSGEFDCKKWDGTCSDSDIWVCVNSTTGRRFNGMYQCHPCRAKYVISYKLGRCPK